MIRKSDRFYVNLTDVYFDNRKAVAPQRLFEANTIWDLGQEASPNA